MQSITPSITTAPLAEPTPRRRAKVNLHAIALVLGLCLLGILRPHAQGFSLSPAPVLEVTDTTGAIVPLACVWSYNSGTTTPATTYSDTLGTANTNPIIAGADGTFKVYLPLGVTLKYVEENVPCSSASHGPVLRTIDPVAAVPAYTYTPWTVGQPTDAGVVNNWVPNSGAISGSTELFINTTGLTITGFAGGKVAGQQILLQNIGTGIVSLVHQSSSSSAGNKINNLVASGPTSLAPGGVALYTYDGTTYWRLVSYDQGAWISLPFGALAYTGDAGGLMTWTVTAGEVMTQAYKLRGTDVTVTWDIQGSTTSGTAANYVQISNRAWGGFVPAFTKLDAVAYLNDGTTVSSGFAAVAASGTSFSIYRVSAANYALVSGGFYTYGTVTIPVQ